MDSVFFLFGGGEGEVIFVFSLVHKCVLILFSCGTPCSKVVPQEFLNSTSALSHMVCPKSNSHV
jgi:hypothetical protein